MKTTFDDVHKENCEHKSFAVHRTGLESPSSRIVYFDCPWCEIEIKAYVWSMCGGGKRCECGAIFGGSGGHKLMEKKT